MMTTAYLNSSLEYSLYYNKICFIGLLFNEGDNKKNTIKLESCIDLIKKIYNDEVKNIKTNFKKDIQKLKNEEQNEINEINKKFQYIFKTDTSAENTFNYSYELASCKQKFKLLKNIEIETTKRSLYWLNFTFKKKYNEMIYTFNLDKM